MRKSDAVPPQLEQALSPKYQVLRWIGGGGMAQVYLARNRTTGGLFAVKVLADHLSGDDAVVGRFLQEARTSAALSGHPNIVSIFDVGQMESTHYIIMQYVDGEDLKTRLARRGKVPPEEAAGMIEQIADALVFAHSRVVVHRDLKPSNIKIQPTGRVVVLDFGIAKAGDAPTQFTTAGQCIGTPHYMSPEQFATGTCDPRSDLYSLGVVFFELLTGRRPFEGDSIQQIEAAHRSTPAFSPCELDPSIPEAYGRLALRLLEKRPEDRFQTAAEVITAVRQLRRPDTAPAAAPPVDNAPAPSAPALAVTDYSPDPPHKRRWLVPSVVAGVIVVGVAGGIFAISTRTRIPKAGPSGGAESTVQPALSGVKVVANTEYKAFCDSTGHPFPEPLPQNPNYFYAEPGAPVLNVSYQDAQAFAAWAGKRLLTQSEWKSVGDASGSRPAAEWTSTRYVPTDSDREAFRKLAGADPAGDWVAIEGEAPLRGWPSGAGPAGFAIGFRCMPISPGKE